MSFVRELAFYSLIYRYPFRFRISDSLIFIWNFSVYFFRNDFTDIISPSTIYGVILRNYKRLIRTINHPVVSPVCNEWASCQYYLTMNLACINLWQAQSSQQSEALPWLMTDCIQRFILCKQNKVAYPDSKVHGASMGPTWGPQDPGGPNVGPINLDIWVYTSNAWWDRYRISIKIHKYSLYYMAVKHIILHIIHIRNWLMPYIVPWLYSKYSLITKRLFPSNVMIKITSRN